MGKPVSEDVVIYLLELLAAQQMRIAQLERFQALAESAWPQIEESNDEPN